jgi:iron(III) transport system ATP-binding protein
VLDVRNLAKTYTKRRASGTVALDGLDLRVAEGELVTVLGPSGCGKTTLLRVIAGFEVPDSGTVDVAGRRVAGDRFVPAHERGIGLVPQDGALFPHLSVAQNVGFGLTGLRRADRRTRVEEALALVGLEGFATRRPHELSGGQQQRVALARAIAPGPRIVLLDEPFSALDEYLRETLRAEVRALLERLGTTTVMVTHDQEEALSMGDRVAVMREGRIVQADEPRQTYYQPADLELARFLGDAVVVTGDIRAGAEVSCVFGVLPVADAHGSQGRCDVLIRPENLRVRARTEPGVPGIVRDQTFYGHDGLLHVDVPELGRQVRVRVIGDHPYRVGDEVHLVAEHPVCTYPPALAAA